MPMDLTDGRSTLVQVMAWCRQATSHLLKPILTQIYGVIRPQWVKVWIRMKFIWFGGLELYFVSPTGHIITVHFTQQVSNKLMSFFLCGIHHFISSIGPSRRCDYKYWIGSFQIHIKGRLLLSLSIFCEIALRWMLQNIFDDEAIFMILVKLMAWCCHCCQATSHYMSQCWPRYLSP